MVSPLSSILSGTDNALSSGPDDEFAGDGGPVLPVKQFAPAPAKPAPVSKPTPVSVSPAPKPTPQPAAKDEDAGPMVMGEGGPVMQAKRIAMPDKSVLVVPGSWPLESVDVLARELHSLSQTIIQTPSAIYHAATDPATEEEKQKYGEKTIQSEGPLRAVDRMVYQPTINAIQDYAAGKVSIDDVLATLPEALGGAGGAVLAGKAAGDVGNAGRDVINKTVTSTKAPAEPTSEGASESESGLRRAGDYKEPRPKGLNDDEMIDWLNKNATDAAKLDTFRHEMAHYDYGRQAGMKPEDFRLIAGHEVSKMGDVKGFSQAQLMSNDGFWQQLMKSAKGPARTAAATAYIKQLLAPEVVEELQGQSPEDAQGATAHDNWQADKFLQKKLKMSPEDAEAFKNQVRNQLKQEIDADKMRAYTHAAKQIVKGHYGPLSGGSKGLAWGADLERYLNGESYDPSKTYRPPWADDEK